MAARPDSVASSELSDDWRSDSDTDSRSDSSTGLWPDSDAEWKANLRPGMWPDSAINLRSESRAGMWSDSEDNLKSDLAPISRAISRPNSRSSDGLNSNPAVPTPVTISEPGDDSSKNSAVDEQGMALSVALPLSGLDTDTFSSFNLFGIKEILAISQPSPSPSASSDSSGLGSLGSIPASPDDNDKASFADKIPVPDLKVIYRGRNILDVKTNTDPAGWKFQYAYLPPNNPTVFFANRSQYHRLTYPQVEFETETCSVCGFKSIKTD